MSRTAEALGGRGDRWHSAHCVELGATVLVDSLDEFDASGDEISSDSATQSALLLGAAFGWDFLQGEHLSLGLGARLGYRW